MTTPTTEQPSFKEWFHGHNKPKYFDPNYLPHLEELCEAYANHKLMKVEVDPYSEYKFIEAEDDTPAHFIVPESHLNDLLRKVAALQECLTMQHDIIAKKDKMQSALQKELDDCYKNYDNIKQQLTEANAEIERLKQLNLVPEHLSDFVVNVDYMIECYQNGKITNAERMRDAIAEDLDYIMRIKTTNP